jgi:thiamine-monophosphate kinase
LARASGVVVDFQAVALQPDADLLTAAELLGEPDPAGWVLTGGEDHALLACFAPDAELPPSFRRIGAVGAVSARSAAGLVLLDGEPVAGPGGWRHFA